MSFRLPRPFFIFIVGLAGVGKTAISKELIRRFPSLTHVSDLAPLKELFEIDHVTREALNGSNDVKLGIQLTRMKNLEITYWEHMLNERIGKIRSGETRSINIQTILADNGGYDILDPQVWDDVLTLSVSKLYTDKCYVFEFARGTDVAYAEKYNLDFSTIYLRCFQLIGQKIDILSPQNSLIIHVYVRNNENLRRNDLRRLNGEHYVANHVMESIYKTDIFEYHQLSKGYGILSPELPIPVISVDNTATMNWDIILAEVLSYIRCL